MSPKIPAQTLCDQTVVEMTKNCTRDSTHNDTAAHKSEFRTKALTRPTHEDQGKAWRKMTTRAPEHYGSAKPKTYGQRGK
jgi:hypothetical protein